MMKSTIPANGPTEQDYAFLFLDIMGFKNIVEKAEPVNTVQLIEVLKSMNDRVKNHCEFLTKVNNKSLSAITFSDCTIVFTPSGSRDFEKKNAVNLCCMAADALYWGFMQKHVLVRGGLSFGNLMHDGDVVFGKAFNEAYTTEQSARYPRIAIHESAFPHVDKTRLSTDDDGTSWLNPMSVNSFCAGVTKLPNQYANKEQKVLHEEDGKRNLVASALAVYKQVDMTAKVQSEKRWESSADGCTINSV
jgi:hypothetical protein